VTIDVRGEDILTGKLGDPVATALRYHARGWSPVPVMPRGKKPVGNRWQTQRLGTDDILGAFRADNNIGILLGEASGWLVDVDLDSDQAIELAPRCLPPTKARFGKSSTPEAHWLYVAEGSESTKYAMRTADGGSMTLVELRASGQTVFPGSVHVSGQPIDWMSDERPARVGRDELSSAVRKLAAASALYANGYPVEAAYQIAGDPQAIAQITGPLGESLRAWAGIKEPEQPAPRPRARPRFDRESAIEKYNRDNPRKWPRAGTGTCPICKHNECFGAIGSEGKAFCFSAGHTGGGRKTKNGWLVDSLDVDASESGFQDIGEFLRSLDYLPPLRIAPMPLKPDEGADDEPQRGRETREIAVDADMRSVVDQAIEALAEGTEIYQSGGVLMHVVSDATGGDAARNEPRLVAVGVDWLRVLLSDAARWTAHGPDGRIRDVTPPAEIARAIVSCGEWPGIRHVSSVVEVPVLRPDGTVVDVPGYDTATQVVYRPLAHVAVPASPTQADARAAAELLLDAVSDFPFASPGHRSSWLACVLSLFARYAFEGAAPLFAMDANTRGSGKTLLAKAASIIGRGRRASVMAPIDNEDEMRKTLLAIALEGRRMVVFDNVRRVGGGSIEAMLTTNRVTGRMLGLTQSVEGEFRGIFVATGNNIEMSADMCRRVCHVRIESDEERPEERSGFKHPELETWLDTEWPKLATAALTILRAYCVAGRPLQQVRPWGSYEQWNRLIAHAIRWCGLPNLDEARQDLLDRADEERNTLHAFLCALAKHFTYGRFTVKDLMADAEHSEALRTALIDFCPPRRGGPLSAISVGRKLARIAGKVVAGMRVNRAETVLDGCTVWSIQTVTKGGA